MHIKLNELFKLIIGDLINDKFADNSEQQIGNDIAGCFGRETARPQWGSSEQKDKLIAIFYSITY